jgi:hypothetical protein
MKREAIGHTKMKRLCRRLNVPLWQAVRLLESIWLLTGREVPRGDIGKLTDEDIALAIDYRGDESELIEALVSSGWIDRDATDRLIVHDWHVHADDAVHMRLARARLYFVGGYAPKLTRLSQNERGALNKFYTRQAHGVRTASTLRSAPPEPEPEPEPEPDPRQSQSQKAPSPRSDRFLEWFDGFKGRKAKPNQAARAWTAYVTVETEDAAFACRDRYNASQEVADGALMEADRFLTEQSDNGWAGDWPAARGCRADAEWQEVLNGGR